MESSKIPFIAEYPTLTLTRPRKQFRPISTRPWTLALYLAATGICFGLLLAIDLIEKEPTPIAKRDVYEVEKHAPLLPRQDTAAATSITADETECTTTVVATVIVCITQSNYVCTETTYLPPDEPGSCVTETTVATIYSTGSLLSLTSQDPTSPVDSAAAASTITTPVVATSDLLSLASDDLISLTAENTAAYTTTEEVSSVAYTTDVLDIDSPTAAETPLPTTTTSNEISLTAASTYSYVTLPPDLTLDPPVLTVSPTLELSFTSAALSLTSPSTTETEVSLATSVDGLINLDATSITAVASSSDGVISLVSQPTLDTTTSSEASPASPLSGLLNLNGQSTTETVAYSTSQESELSLTSSLITDPLVISIATLTSVPVSPSDVPSTILTSAGTYIVIVSPGGSETQPYTEQQSTRTPTIFSVTPVATTTGISLTSTASTVTSPTSTSKPGWKDPVPSENLVVIKLKFQHYQYFLAVYLPKIIAVIMSTVWSIIFAGLKLMEPFYQLSANTGVSASNSMFGNYLASEISLASLSAIFRGQWVLILAGLILVGWAAIVALISESMIVISLGSCTGSDGKQFRCNPGWAVNRPILNTLLGLIGFVFMLTSVLLLLLVRRNRTGVFTDPSSIASMAELLSNPQVMDDLQGIKPSSSDREVKLFLGENRYKIGLYDSMTGKETLFDSSQLGDPRWGLIKIDQVPSGALTRKQQNGYGAVMNPNIAAVEEMKANRNRRLFQIVFDSFMLLTALCIFGLVLGYWLDSKSDPLNDFFNRGAFGPQFVLTSLALILSVGWRKISQEITVMGPYRSMARASQANTGVPAERSILVATALTPWTAFYKGLVLRQYMITIVAVCAMSADLLLVAISGVPFNSGQTAISLRVATFVSFATLALMIIGSILVIFYNRASAGGTRKLPRSPDTLIGVWLYLCHSRLVTKKEGFDEDFESPLNDTGLKAKYGGYQCGFARVAGTDGVRRWTVDAVTALASAGASMTSQSYDKLRENVPFSYGAAQSQQQRPQPSEASATPIDSSYHYNRPRRNSQRGLPVSEFQPLPQQPQYYPHEVQFFEAQAKSPAAEIPQLRFEEMRHARHGVVNENSELAQFVSQRRAVQSRHQADPSPQETLMMWEYEQAFHGRSSVGSSEHARWTNDGRTRYRLS